MRWTRTYRTRTATLDKGLVLACWWLITRSMVLHAVMLSALVMFATSPALIAQTPSYVLILHWAPLWAWGAVLSGAALTWWLGRGVLCVLAGIVVALWFFAFACAYLAAWVASPAPGTIVTGWLTYGFLGWAWMCVTYVVWKDEEHVRAEVVQLRVLEAVDLELDEQSG